MLVVHTVVFFTVLHSNSILCSGCHLFVQLSYPLIHIYYFYTNTIHLCNLIIGFAGYFDATLYKDVHLGTEPSKATPDLLSWYILPLCPPVILLE
jgi:hypothetical protein